MQNHEETKMLAKQVLKDLDDYKRFLQNLPGYVYWKNKDGVYLGCNQTALDSIGLKSVDELIGKTDKDFSWWREADVFIRHDREVMLFGSKSFEELTTMPDQSQIAFTVVKAPFYDALGNLAGIVGISLDITERRQSEQQLQEAKKAAEIFYQEEKANNLNKTQVLQEIKKELIGSDLPSENPDEIQQMLLFLKSIISNMPGNVYWKDTNSVYMGGNDNAAKVCGVCSRFKLSGITDEFLEKTLHWAPGTADRFRQDDLAVIH